MRYNHIATLGPWAITSLDSDGSGMFLGPGDLSGTPAMPLDPKLGPLQDNGGPTLTLALLPGSPAIDAGNSANAPGTDQRGLPRIAGSVIDIGACEVQAPHANAQARGRRISPGPRQSSRSV